METDEQYRTPFERDQAAFDMSRASIARAYDAVIGGKDNFEPDRQWADELTSIHPSIAELALSGRRWLVRTVGYLADRCGMDQFLDIGSGLPTVQNTHEVAQRYQPSAHVVYVDNDPAVTAFEQALLNSASGHTAFSAADLTNPAEVLADPAVGGLDWHHPVVMLQCLTMHHVPDELDPWSIMRDYIDALPRGSYVVFSHLSNPGDGSVAAEIAHAMSAAFADSDFATGYFRSPTEIEAMTEGLELLEPGLVPLETWWPSGPRELSASDPVPLGGVGYKP